MKKHIQKVKKVNSDARLLGLDIGRKYIGLAITDRQIKTCRVRTLLSTKLILGFQDSSDRSTALQWLVRL